jgi:hypothetical protein
LSVWVQDQASLEAHDKVRHIINDYCENYCDNVFCGPCDPCTSVIYQPCICCVDGGGDEKASEYYDTINDILGVKIHDRGIRGVVHIKNEQTTS